MENRIDSFVRAVFKAADLPQPVKVDLVLGHNKVTDDYYCMIQHRGSKVCATFKQISASSFLVGG